jgi:hypothetical protein
MWHAWRRGVIQRVVVGKSEGTIPVETRRYRLGNNIKMVVEETQWNGVNWFNLTQDRNNWWAVVSTVMNVWVSSNVKDIFAS